MLPVPERWCASKSIRCDFALSRVERLQKSCQMYRVTRLSQLVLLGKKEPSLPSLIFCATPGVWPRISGKRAK